MSYILSVIFGVKVRSGTCVAGADDVEAKFYDAYVFGMKQRLCKLAQVLGEI